ncbi:MAG: cofactor assembly of complex C subunit B [Oscillatoriales cyanobacterium]|nr:MAG: cofactor assembly of complex C subunit B [Oscillatoriales cyanobacterium]
MARSQTDRWLQRLPIAVGSLLGVGLFVNRSLTPDISEWQARSDVAGTIACAVLILTGLLWQRVQPKQPDAVELVGNEGFELADDLAAALKIELAWASHLLLTNTVTRSIVLYADGRTLLRRGILGTQSAVTPGPIVQRVLDTQKPVYLVALNVYPGRIEFDYLPENTQGVIVQPLGDRGVLILGANAPRSYTNQDERWIEGIADKLANSLTKG